MKGLIILAHGSRREQSNEEIRKLTDRVRQQSKNEYQLIEYAFLELVEPDLLSAIKILIDEGITAIKVLPYFLNSGNHVAIDIPNLIDEANERFPNCQFNIAKAIGMDASMPELVLKCARDSHH